MCWIITLRRIGVVECCPPSLEDREFWSDGHGESEEGVRPL